MDSTLEDHVREALLRYDIAPPAEELELAVESYRDTLAGIGHIREALQANPDVYR
ncbi:hypothetical protein [Amycolatopsis sp. A1MSW2902]|uniref:hypothetical protein n=1 Tax=Amycolatopsis sp. A1MSW2902 TaxID=687413 RepID=UPI00307F8262